MSTHPIDGKPARRSPAGQTLATAIAMAIYGTSAYGQDPSSTARVAELEVVVVTGSYITGAAEDAALPIDVLTADDLLKQGSPSMTELIKSLPSSQGVFGDSNQFGAGQSTGSANVNLRGLGALRTLVLLNGRRVAPNPAINAGVDINLFPVAAIERIEVLKDGAAATYGSDAIAGVVNFITKRNFEGLQVDGSYSYIQDSDGDYNTNLVYGWNGENTDVLLSAGYRHRSELHAIDRDWAVRSYADNPSGGWTSFGSPGAYQAGAVRFIDPQCESLGGIPTGTVNGVGGSPTSGTGVAPSNCQFQYTQFANLVEREEHYQAFAQLDHRFGEETTLRAELLYAGHDVPEENSSPSYGPNQGPNGGAPTFFIPRANPGFDRLFPQLSTAAQNAITAGGGAATSGLFWRPIGAGGNPLTGEGKKDERLFYTYRGSIELDGQLTQDTAWNVAVTYGETTADIATPDIFVSRLDRALRGLGGPDCTGTTPGAGGCLWFNPFSTGVQSNAATNAQNPQFDPNSANSNAVVDWMFEDFAYELTQSLLTVDAVLNGETGLSLGGGNIAWAFGAQYRENGYKRDPNDSSDLTLLPCAASPVNPNATCTANGQLVGTGPFSFQGALTGYDLSQQVFGVFGELSLPFTESFQAQLAVRYEDYGGAIGDTVDPKLALRWQVADFLALRGSVSTTFRAPQETAVVPGFIVSSAFTPAAGGYKPYRTNNNPDLAPETAIAFNVGAIVKLGGFSASLDYWSFDFEDVIDNESGLDLIARFYRGATTANPAPNCGNPELAALQARLTFNNGVCGAASTALVLTDIQTINGADAKISGIDASLQYDFEDVLGGLLTLGLDGTYNLKYEQGANFIEGIEVRAADDYVGTRGTNGSQPRWKGSLFVEFGRGEHNVRWVSRYIDEMEDTRVQSSTAAFANITPGSPGATVDSYLTHDLHYRLGLASRMTFNASLLNVADEDPPFARLDLNYDPFTGSPVGRVVKVGVTKRF
jgi:iron complex outermembrane recepter protein